MVGQDLVDLLEELRNQVEMEAIVVLAQTLRQILVVVVVQQVLLATEEMEVMGL